VLEFSEASAPRCTGNGTGTGNGNGTGNGTGTGNGNGTGTSARPSRGRLSTLHGKTFAPRKA
jgi:hypothetical protein